MFKFGIGVLALLQLVRCIAFNVTQTITQSSNYTGSVQLYAQNHTVGFKVDWGNVEQLHNEEQYLELIVSANITKFPFEQYQVPFLCVSNHTPTTFYRSQIIEQPRIGAIECDIYAYKTNEGNYRINVSSKLQHNETQFYISFFNLTSLSNQELTQIPVGFIELNTSGTLTDNNFWNVDLEIGIYKENSKPLYCHERGEFNVTSQFCACDSGYGGAYCEFQISTVDSEAKTNIVLQPYEYAFYKFDYDDFYNLILDLNNTVSFNFFFGDQIEPEFLLQHKFISTFFTRSYKLQHKKKAQTLPLPYNSTVNSIVFWFKNDNIQPIEMEFTMRESSKSFLEEFIQVLISYLFYTLVGGLLFCGCSFCTVVFASKAHKQWTIFMRKRQMEKQLPLMTYQQFKQNQDLHRNNDQSTCSICLGEYEDNDRIRVTWCRHAFHKECIEEWALKKNQCPFCRETIFTILYSSIIEILQRNLSRNQADQDQEENHSEHGNVQLQQLNNNNNIQENLNNNNNNNNDNNNNNPIAQNNRYQNLVEDP